MKHNLQAHLPIHKYEKTHEQNAPADNSTTFLPLSAFWIDALKNLLNRHSV